MVLVSLVYKCILNLVNLLLGYMMSYYNGAAHFVYSHGTLMTQIAWDYSFTIPGDVQYLCCSIIYHAITRI